MCPEEQVPGDVAELTDVADLDGTILHIPEAVVEPKAPSAPETPSPQPR
eukprot:CAMPEP_0179141756 /NCGR_PEP_ID=MMETSP0796-20121207/68025_1 /TAXON_ID=73915 /ORGANISM="Pyrodinium bahamense, Strain pbaha01" /LENGTH=48 /DNA_ID= /DNA_START= /DNA_END= /DNA_ORIENTATION=